MPRRSALLPLLPPLLLLGHVRANCFIGVLQHLSTSPHNCLHREDLSYNISFASIVLLAFLCTCCMRHGWYGGTLT